MEWIKKIYYRIIYRKLKLPNSVIIEAPTPDDAHYEAVFNIGAEPSESKNWKEFRPPYENQRRTYDCVSFSRNTCAEYIADREGLDWLNLSDLHLAVGSKTSMGGNNLNAPSEYLRKSGVVEESFCPYDADMLTNPKGTWSRRAAKVALIPKDAPRFKGGNHSWVVPKNHIMKDALEHSPLQIAIPLYKTFRYGGTLYPVGPVLGYHAVVLEHIDADGRRIIFDSLSSEEKVLSSNYPISQCKSFRDLPQTWKKKQREFPIFYKGNDPAVYMYGLGSGKYYLIPTGKIFNDLFGTFGQSLIVPLGKRINGTSSPLPSDIGGVIRITDK